MKALDLIGLGECMVELYGDEPLGQAQTLTKAYGGDVLNALVMASRLGSRTGFVTRVGNDPFGQGMVEFWRSEGVDTTHAPLVEGENGVYFISLQTGGEREFTYRRASSAASKIGPDDLEPSYLAGTKMLLLSGITQSLSISAQAATLAAARTARGHGVQVAYDPNYRPRLWEARGGLAAAQRAFDEVLPHVDILLPSHPADTVLWRTDLADPERALEDWGRSTPVVALKAGPQGAYVRSAAGSLSRHAPPRGVEVMDSTGAGDAWNGAFLYALSRGQATSAAAKLANLAAAWKLKHRGAIPPREYFDQAIGLVREETPERHRWQTQIRIK